jgi:hypothetical protein
MLMGSQSAKSGNLMQIHWLQHGTHVSIGLTTYMTAVLARTRNKTSKMVAQLTSFFARTICSGLRLSAFLGAYQTGCFQ